VRAKACPDPSHFNFQETLESQFPPRPHEKIGERPSCGMSLPHCASHGASLAEHQLGRRAGQCEEGRMRVG